MARREVFVKNIPRNASASNVIDALSQFGPLSRFELKKRNRMENTHAGYGFAEFVEEEDADDCIALASLFPPECLGQPLVILPSKKNKKSRNRTALDNETKAEFVLSSMEVGNWGGQSSHINQIENRDNRKYRYAAEHFTFLTEWTYPTYYEKPTICFSKSDEAFILQGFNLPEDSSESVERRVKIPFRSLAENSRGIFLGARDQTDELTLYISIKQPPYLYREADKIINEETVERFVWHQEERNFWVRTVDWTGVINIFGRCLVYKLSFKDNIDQLRDLLNNFKLKGIPHNMPQCFVQCIEEQSYTREHFDNVICQILPFRICFKLQSLISNKALTIYEIGKEMLGERLIELVYDEQKQEETAWYALDQISAKHWDPFDKRHQDRPITIFETALQSFRNEYNSWHPSSPNFRLKDISRFAWVNHATITPTSIYVDGPNYEPSNRILRLYEDKTDRFLRVTFREENLDRLYVNKDVDADIINLRISSMMTNGFVLAGRHYQFLAFSSSQLKEMSCWFVAAEGEFNAEFIRSEMGDFSDIKAPSLYASRMGQCFTSTIGTLELDSDRVEVIPEIIRGEWEFSDGCGTISESLAKRALKAYLGKKFNDKEIPSVFQIRFGGCKGVVAVDPNLEDDVLCVRKSQIKFDTPSSTLEIVKISKHLLPGHLNRQIIMLLSALGVPDEIFITLQNEMRAEIDSMMRDEEKARKIVKRSTGTRESSHITRTILSMIDAGMMRGSFEPFLRALLECKRVYALKSLRYKARILVPKSFLLLGVIDETGKLEEGQIYVQTSTIISENQTFNTKDNEVCRDHKVWTGEAVITRNPCLHPGDLRKVEAVDVPELKHLKNCVVFSQKGDRPLPNLLSGGDLDGDEFFVSFDGRIFITGNEDPMNYDPPERRTLDREVEITDICKFFRDFALNDRLGQISNLHLALADYNAEGVKFSGCTDLAQLLSKAVDFNKTGVPVTEKLPTIGEYPDFMENKFKKSYKSQKVLGKLYRNIQINTPQSDPILKYYVGDITPNEDFIFDGYQEYVEEAIDCLDHYNGEIRTLMKKYKVKTEAEILTSQLLGYKRADGRKCQDIRNAIGGTVSFIIHNCRKQFLMGLNTANENVDNDNVSPFNLHVTIPINDETKAKASAWYYVTYDQGDQRDKRCLLSFPWVVADVLLAIRMDKHLEKMNNLLRDLTIMS